MINAATWLANASSPQPWAPSAASRHQLNKTDPSVHLDLSSQFLMNPTEAAPASQSHVVQVLDTYLPGALSTGSLMAAQLNVTSVFESHCVADWMVYNAAGTFAATDFFFVESGQSSDIAPEQLGPHHATKALVEGLLAQGGFRHNYTR